ncbi:MAG: threonine synthase [Oscillospiraceae bacterium]|nr:threonine synthase [Oscillospiraceae bacterium]
MNYFSTRDVSLKVSSAEAIVKGLSGDGGLFCPESIPKLTDEDKSFLLNAPYKKRAAFILGKFLSDFSSEELEFFADKAYNTEKFDTEAIAPVRMLDNKLGVLELWHGPTSAFKDMALQMLPYLLSASLKKTGEKRLASILVATSGDTGKAALEGFADVPGTKIAVFYPKDGVSKIQERQMTTQSGDNVYVSSVVGNFDDVQSAMKAIFSDEEIRAKASDNGCIFSSANSINWGRAVPQIAYYVSGYFDMLKSGAISESDEINVCVPTGNFGNILAAFYAKEMGIPIKKFICASNSNNVLTDFFRTGKYDKCREFHVTTSPAMDILISSNLERLIFNLSGNDDKTVKKYMAKLQSDGAYTVSSEIFEKISALFYGGCCSDEETLKTISNVYSEHNYLIDTHTAVGVNVYNKYVAETGDDAATLLASTASPFKFADSVLSALGIDIESGGEELLKILSKTTGQKIPAPLASIFEKEERFLNTAVRDELPDVVLRFTEGTV